MALIKIVVYTENNDIEKDLVVNEDNLFNTLYEITAEYNNEITIFAGYDAREDIRCIELRQNIIMKLQCLQAMMPTKICDV